MLEIFIVSWDEIRDRHLMLEIFIVS